MGNRVITRFSKLRVMGRAAIVGRWKIASISTMIRSWVIVSVEVLPSPLLHSGFQGRDR
jgi:hypothetical protein